MKYEVLAQWMVIVFSTTGTLLADTNSIVGFAAELSEAGHHDAAAVEYRRLALEAMTPDDQAGYYWGAAYQYAQTNDALRAFNMLERAEAASRKATGPALLLRAGLSRSIGDSSTARFYFESLMKDEDASMEMKEFCHRQLAAISLESGKLDDARQQLQGINESDERSQAEHAVRRYETGHDKSPAVGGTLGLIPGLGHMYAGEFANGFRCLILNSIFIYGMTESAESDNWGAFAVITFFELTWYSGSIYGGRDAVERYNLERMNEAVRTVEGSDEPKPRLLSLPLIQISF
jgi:hypothetical protein